MAIFNMVGGAASDYKVEIGTAYINYGFEFSIATSLKSLTLVHLCKIVKDSSDYGSSGIYDLMYPFLTLYGGTRAIAHTNYGDMRYILTSTPSISNGKVVLKSANDDGTGIVFTGNYKYYFVGKQ